MRRTLIAITRQVSASINDCELSFHARQPIDVGKAIAQHKAYEDCLAGLGVRIVSLPAEPELPDAVFVEDPAVVVDEVAIISNMGAPSRRPEAKSLAEALARYRPIKFLTEPATLDGGDVMRIDRSVFVGLSQRTNREGIAQLSDLLRVYGYQVEPVEVKGCLHLKSACSYIGNDTVLVNRSLIDAEPLRRFELLDVPDDEPGASERVARSRCGDHPCFFSQDSRFARAARVSRADDRLVGAAKSRSRRDMHKFDLQQRDIERRIFLTTDYTDGTDKKGRLSRYC